MLGKSLTLAAVLAGLAGSQGTDVEQQVALLVRLDAQLARELKLVSQPLNAPVLSAHITTDASQDTLRITFSCVPGVYIVQTRLLISAPVRLDAGHCARTTGVTLFARGTLSGMLRTQGAVPDALYFDVKRCVGGRLGVCV
jgi:hypothetical protein